MSEVIDYLTEKGITYKLQGNEAAITCPFCKKKDKLSINIQTGVFHCWVCSAKYSSESPYSNGHISQLMKLWGDIAPISSISDVSSISKKEKDDPDFTNLMTKYHNDIWNHKNAVKYLFKRGFDENDIKEFKYGFVAMKGEDWVVIPSLENGICKLLKYRKITNNTDLAKYLREPGGKSILHNSDALVQSEILVTEGEFNCDILRKFGYDGVVSATTGAGSLSPEWYEQLYKKEKIILVLDPDEVGQAASKNIWSTRLGIAKCWNVLLPPNIDVNDYFLTHKKEEFDELIANAKQFRVSGVVSLAESLHMMYDYSLDEANTKTYCLPWENVNKMIGGGLQRKRLTVVAGIPGSGKTSWALQVCYHLAKEYNIPSLFWCLEMPEISLATKIIQLDKDLMIDEVNYSDALIYLMELEGLPIYFGYSSNIKPKTFYNTMVEVRNRYGVEFGVFDNLQRMVRTGEESDVGTASGIFKDITMDLNIPFMVISQPRKLASANSTPTNDDLKGSSAIPADADEVVWLYRKTISDPDGNSSMEPECQIIVSKSRFSSGGRTFLTFQGAKSKFEED